MTNRNSREYLWEQFVSGYFHQDYRTDFDTFDEEVEHIWKGMSADPLDGQFLLTELRDRVHGSYSDEQLWKFWRSGGACIMPYDIRAWFTVLLQSYEAYLAKHGIDFTISGR